MFVAVVIIVFALIGFTRGFIKTCLSFFPGFISLILTSKIYPVFSKFLRTTPLYEHIKSKVIDTISIENISSELANSDYIDSLPFPDFIKSALFENNNAVVYDMLGVSKIEEYVGGYVANIFLNIISMIVVAVFIAILIKLVFVMLDIATRLPVVHEANSFGGLVAGAVEGVLIIWVIFLIAVLFVSKDNWFYISLYNSKVAILLFENNILLKFILKIFG